MIAQLLHNWIDFDTHSFFDASPLFPRKQTKTTRGREHGKSNVKVTKGGKLICLLNESIPSFWKCNLSIFIAFYSLYLQLKPTHFMICHLELQRFTGGFGSVLSGIGVLLFLLLESRLAFVAIRYIQPLNVLLYTDHQQFWKTENDVQKIALKTWGRRAHVLLVRSINFGPVFPS